MILKMANLQTNTYMSKRFSTKGIVAAILYLLCMLLHADESVILLDSASCWKPWGHTSIIDVERDTEKGGWLFIRRNGDNGWNCPIYMLPEAVEVSESLGFVFRYQAEVTGSGSVVFTNKQDGAEYSQNFQIEDTAWHEIHFVISDSVYKRGGKQGIPPGGMTNGLLSKIQINFHGCKLHLADLALRNLPTEEISELRRPPAYLEEYLSQRQVSFYGKYARNGIFPLGVIGNIREGDRRTGEFLLQSAEERLRNDLLDIRRHGLNAYSNFCNAGVSSLGQRLQWMDEMDLYLLETVTSAENLHKFDDDTEISWGVRTFSSHPRLLAWYGKDEPTDMEAYLKNKQWIEARAGDCAAVTSAFCHAPVVRTLGPAMDIVTVDPYDLTLQVPANGDASLLERHGTVIAQARKACAAERAWIVLQSYGDINNRTQIFRMATPAEARYDLFNAVAQGANGVFYYIYNNCPPYFLEDGIPKTAEVDCLADPWGNPSAQYEAIAQVAPRLTSIMPSFLERKACNEDFRIQTGNSVLQAHCWDNGDGFLLFIINSDLVNEASGQLSFTLPTGFALYDLDILDELPASPQVTLPPGECAIFFAATHQAFRKVQQEIQERRNAEHDIQEKLPPEFPEELQTLRQAFGRMHRRLCSAILESKTMPLPRLKTMQEQIRSLSQLYFQALRDFRATGKFDPNVTKIIPRIDAIEF